MLVSGFVLILRALLAFVELVTASNYLIVPKETVDMYSAAELNATIIFMHLAICVIGYKLWKDPTKKMIRIAFWSAVVLVILTVLQMIASGSILDKGSTLLVIDSVEILAATAAYVVGAVIVRARIDLGQLKPRDKV